MRTALNQIKWGRIFNLKTGAVFLVTVSSVLYALFLYQPMTGWANQNTIPIFFYSSETNINNFKSLKMEFDAMLSGFGPYEFQPFSDRESFENHIKGKHNYLLLLSSWHYRNIYKDFSLKSILVGTREGKTYQKRILVSGPGASAESADVPGPVASASNIPHTRSILKEMYSQGHAIDSVRILTVPKEIDALMSVGFQMAKAALITENALTNLKNLDPVLHQKLKILQEGKPSLLMLVAVPKDFAKGDAVIKIIKDMPKSPDGMNIMKMLDLDDWEMMNAEQLSKLEG
jgi:hypothetical protein